MQGRSLVIALALVGAAFAGALWKSRATLAPPPAAPVASSAALVAPPTSADPEGPAEQPAEPAVAPPIDPAPTASASAGEPGLPPDAPRQVGFGVVLVEYRGAQAASKTAPSRSEALEKAERLRELAEKDFASAVKNGDKGSMENAGSMPRGVLEPTPERVLFGLRVGEVGGPVDTPRGFWVVKRLE